MDRERHEVLIVELAGQRLGLPAGIVRELLRAVYITPWPRGGMFVEGIIDIRGQIVPVLDLRGWLKLPAKPLESGDHLVVLTTGKGLAAVRVERAVELASLEVGTLEHDLPGGDGPGFVARFADGLVNLPDLGPLFAQQPPPEPQTAAREGQP